MITKMINELAARVSALEGELNDNANNIVRISNLEWMNENLRENNRALKEELAQKTAALESVQQPSVVLEPKVDTAASIEQEANNRQSASGLPMSRVIGMMEGENGVRYALRKTLLDDLFNRLFRYISDEPVAATKVAKEPEPVPELQVTVAKCKDLCPDFMVACALDRGHAGVHVADSTALATVTAKVMDTVMAHLNEQKLEMNPV